MRPTRIRIFLPGLIIATFVMLTHPVVAIRIDDTVGGQNESSPPTVQPVESAPASDLTNECLDVCGKYTGEPFRLCMKKCSGEDSGAPGPQANPSDGVKIGPAPPPASSPTPVIVPKPKPTTWFKTFPGAEALNIFELPDGRALVTLGKGEVLPEIHGIGGHYCYCQGLANVIVDVDGSAGHAVDTWRSDDEEKCFGTTTEFFGPDDHLQIQSFGIPETDAGGEDLIKYDPSGKRAWVYQFLSPGKIIKTSRGHYATVYGNAMVDYGFLLLDGNGKPLLDKVFEMPTLAMSDVVETSTGKLMFITRYENYYAATDYDNPQIEIHLMAYTQTGQLISKLPLQVPSQLEPYDWWQLGVLPDDTLFILSNCDNGLVWTNISQDGVFLAQKTVAYESVQISEIQRLTNDTFLIYGTIWDDPNQNSWIWIGQISKDGALLWKDRILISSEMPWFEPVEISGGGFIIPVFTHSDTELVLVDSTGKMAEERVKLDVPPYQTTSISPTHDGGYLVAGGASGGAFFGYQCNDGWAARLDSQGRRQH